MVALSDRRTGEFAQNKTTDGHAYRVFWRLRSSSPWRREEFASRAEAFDRFFELMRKGLTPRWGQV
jgi:hypothetical protein